MSDRYLVELTSPVLVSVEVDAEDEIAAVEEAVHIFRDDVSASRMKATRIEKAARFMAVEDEPSGASHRPDDRGAAPRAGRPRPSGSGQGRKGDL